MVKLIKPSREGLKVRKPDGNYLKPDGERLLMKAWWHRRQAEGDVTITDVSKEPATAAVQKHKAGEK